MCSRLVEKGSMRIGKRMCHSWEYICIYKFPHVATFNYIIINRENLICKLFFSEKDTGGLIFVFVLL